MNTAARLHIYASMLPSSLSLNLNSSQFIRQAPYTAGRQKMAVAIRKKRKSRDDQVLEHRGDDEFSLDEHFEIHDGAPIVDIWMIPNLLGRWFKTERINSFGSWTCDAQGVDWDDFEAVLDKYPDLASFEEEADPMYIPIIFHCLHSRNPVVPASVMKKLITINPGLLSSRFFFGDVDMSDRPVGMSVIQVAIEGIGRDADFEVCRVLIEAKPSLLLQTDDDGQSGEGCLLSRFPKAGKKLCRRLVASGRLSVSQEAITAANQEVVERMPWYFDWCAEEEEEGEMATRIPNPSRKATMHFRTRTRA
jgi:hypothetical protein